jgi:hypothetical protein
LVSLNICFAKVDDDRMRPLILALVLLSACGSVTEDSPASATGGVAGGAAGATGGAVNSTGGAAGGVGGSSEIAGAAAGAGGMAGELGGRAGASSGGAAGPGGAAGGQLPGVSTAPVCKGTEIGGPECPRIADPAYPGNANAGWQCLLGCSSIAAENASGCVFSGVTYCVSSCDACRY